MHDKAMTIILLTIMIIAPMTSLVSAGQVSVQGQVTGQVNLGQTHSAVDLQLSATANESSNAAGALKIELTASSDHTNISGHGSANITLEAEDAPDFNLSVLGAADFNSGNYTLTAQIQIYANLSSGGNTTYMMQSISQLPSKEELPVIASALGGIMVNPPQPPMINYTGSMIFTLNLSYQKTGWMSGLSGHTEEEANGAFKLTNGALMIGVPGDIVGTITLHGISNTVNGTTTSDSTINITFNSGNPQVDQLVAQQVYMYLQFYIYNGYNTNVTLQLVGTSIIITRHTVSQFYAINLPSMPNIPGNIPGMGPFGNITIPEVGNATVIPVFYENATGHAAYSLSIRGEPDKNDIAVSGMFTGFVSGINPDSTPFFPTAVALNGQLNGNTANLTIHLEGDGDPSIPFLMVKSMLLLFQGPGCSIININVAIQTDGSVHFYNVATGEDLGTSLTVTCENLALLRHIIVAEEGALVNSPAMGVLKINGGGVVTLGIEPLMLAKVLEVNSTKVVVSTGDAILAAPKAIHMITGGGRIVVVLLDQTVIRGKLELQSLGVDEANDLASQYGYTALGPGVKVNGIAKGSVSITLPLKQEASNVAVLEISENGSTKLITDVYVHPNGTITFTANSFSSFIPVAQAQTTTTTTQSTTSTTSTSTTGTGGYTTTTTSQTSTSQTSGTTTHLTYTTSTVGGTTGQGTTTTGAGGGSGTSSTGQTSGTGTSGGGSNAGLIAGAVIVIIIIIAAAFYVMRR